MSLFSGAPAILVSGTLVTLALTASFSGMLVWHGVRRALDIPRVPRERTVYAALAVAWAALVTACAATVLVALLLRDHSRVDGRTAIGEVRCEPAGPGRVRAEITSARPAAAAEGYEMEGDACLLSVRELEMRAGLRALGVPTLARLESVGPEPRPAANPGWLAPGGPVGAHLLALVVRRSQVVPIAVPADPHQRFVLTAAPDSGPVLVPAPSPSVQRDP